MSDIICPKCGKKVHLSFFKEGKHICKFSVDDSTFEQMRTAYSNFVHEINELFKDASIKLY